MAMTKTVKDVEEMIKNRGVKMVDFKFVDLPGQWHHITVPAHELDERVFEAGIAFDGSSVRGFKSIENSDMMLLPDPDTAILDPFTAVPTLSVVCDIYDPGNGGARFSRDARHIAQKAEAYLKATGIADASYWGPEPEFYIFDDVRFEAGVNQSFYYVDAEEAYWNTGREEGPNLGYKIRHKGGYVPAAPNDALHDIRTEMVLKMEECGITVERHHHEVGSPGQCEINFRFDTLTATADKTMLYKYIVKNVARAWGKTATFMPKPLYGEAGNGLHMHTSLFKDGQPLFYAAGKYANLSETALYYIGGILKHTPALLAITNPSTNSYKRLVPGYEAPVNIVFSKGNRSSTIRVPLTNLPKATRIEFRCPDPACNPYLAYAAVLMAGLDGIKNKIDPVAAGFGPLDKNIYKLSDEEKAKIKSTPASLDEAMEALEKDHAFLLAGNVFTEDMIKAWLELKRCETAPLKLRPHPYEYQLYYDI